VATQQEQDIANQEAMMQYGISEALLAMHPELNYVYELFKSGQKTKAIEELFKTPFYQNTNSVVKAREKMRLEQAPAYQNELDKYKLAARKRLVTSGVKIDDATFNALAEKAYASGLDDNQFDQSVIATGKIAGYGGNVLGDTSTLKTFANSFGVASLLNDKYWSGKSAQLFAGTTTTEDIQEEIKKLSASAFPAYAEGIMNGISLDVQASNVTQTVATYLELDPNAISFQDDTVRKLMQYKDPTTGKPTQMPQWLIEQTVKSDPRWGKTKNAQNTIDTLTHKVASDFGLVY
jgi:hypothetical protein